MRMIKIPKITIKVPKDVIEAIADAVVEKMYAPKPKSENEMLLDIKNEVTMLHIFNRKNVVEIIDKYIERRK